MRFGTMAAVAAAVALGGCTSLNRLRTDLSAPPPTSDGAAPALVATLREIYRGQCPPKDKGASCIGVRSDLTQADINRFADAGMTLSDIYCDRFFRQTNQSARHRRFTNELANDVSTVVAGALNLAKAGADAITASTLGFNAVKGTFSNYDESFMVSTDLSKLRRLVLAAQDNMRLHIQNEPPKTIFAAESKILRYAGLCSFLGMQDLLNTAVTEKTAEIDKVNEGQAKPLAKPSPTPTPVAAPAAMVAPLPPPG